MNKQEFAVIAVGIKSAYPASKILEDDASMNFWYRMLKDLNGKVVENAVMEHISTSVYPPNIAEIRKLCMEGASLLSSVLTRHGEWSRGQCRSMDGITRRKHLP